MSMSLRRALLRRLPARYDDRGSLPLVMLIVVIGTGLAGLLLPMLLQQGRNTNADNYRLHQLNAAESGLDVVLGLVRHAIKSGAASEGDPTQLPCTAAGPMTGTVSGSSALKYSVKVAYYIDNPAGKTGDWLLPYASDHPERHGMICAESGGTWAPPALYAPDGTATPSYLVITSTGNDGHGGRTIAGTYVVQTTNVSVAGGFIKLYPITSGAPVGYPSTGYCMDAGDAQPPAGRQVVIAVCDTSHTADTDRPPPQQAWAYRSDLSIQLVSSVTPQYPNGLCLSGWTGSSYTNASGKLITLQPCKPLGSAPYYQQFSVNDSGHLEISNTGETDTNGVCIYVQSQTNTNATTKYLRLQGDTSSLSCSGGSTTDPAFAWIPSPNAGSGNAGPDNFQLVNFHNFSQCVDVTNQSVSGTNSGAQFLIAYSCKQNPDPSKVAWNQKFQYLANGTLVTVSGGTNYCMKTAAPWSAPGTGPYVTVAPCGSCPASACTWTVHHATQSNGDPEPGNRKYHIVDHNGNCLSITDGNTDVYNQYPKVIVETCDDITTQEWNAQADRVDPTVEDYTELYNTGTGG